MAFLGVVGVLVVFNAVTMIVNAFLWSAIVELIGLKSTPMDQAKALFICLGPLTTLPLFCIAVGFAIGKALTS